MRARTLLAITFSAALAVLAPAAASAQFTTGPFPCGSGCVGSYSGKLVADEERPTYSDGIEIKKTTWTWSESLIDLGGGQSAWLLNDSSASGTVTYSVSTSDNCTFTSGFRPDAAQSWQIATPGGGAQVVDRPAIFGPTRDANVDLFTNENGTTKIDLNPSGAQGYLVAATPPGNEMLTTKHGAAGVCPDLAPTLPGVLEWPSIWSWATPGDPGPCHYTSYSAGETVFFPSSTSPVTVTSSCLGHIDAFPDSHATLTESLTFQGAPLGFSGNPGPPSAPQKPLAGPPTPRNTDYRKTVAGSDLPPAAKDAIVPCTAVALGSAAGAQRGGVLTGLAKRGDASSPESLPDAGDALASAWRDLCDESIARIKHDYKTAEDPPVDDWHTFARLAKTQKQPKPSCARKRDRDKALCQLRADQTAALAAAKRASTAGAGIETTVDRETAALAAGSTAVAAKQNTTAAALGKQFDAALAALRTAEASRSRHLKALGLRLAPAKPAVKKGQKLILKRLASQGITLAALRPYIGNVLGR